MISHNNIQRGRILRIAAGITMLALLLAGSAGASTLTVNASGGANYTSIQDAIDNASDGDTILVYSGIYYENVNVNRQLILRGIGMPVVDALGNGSAITLIVDGIILEGFTATGAVLTEYGASPNAGIKVTSNNNTLIGNNALDNDGGTVCKGDLTCKSHGISLEYSNNNTLIGNNANRNGGYYRGDGIFLYISNNNKLMDNNASSNSNGISLIASDNNTLMDNNASSNDNHGISLSYDSLWGIMGEPSRNNTLIGNKATYNIIGINVYSFRDTSGHSDITEDYNTLNNNTVTNNENGIFLSSKKNTLTGNNASNNTNSGIHIDTYMSRFGIDNGENTLNNNIVLNNGKGIYLLSKSNMLTGNNASNNTGSGIYIKTYASIIDSADNGNNTLNFNSISNNGNGVSIDFSRNNTVMGNNILNNDNGIILLNNSDGNLIYNNNFSNINNANDSGNNTWNTTKTSGTNIVGGPYLAGNFWANPGGTGFSQMCSDVNGDGICDDPYVLYGNNIDHLPLSMNFTIDTISPANITNLTNITYAPIYINFTWTNPPDPDYHHVMLFLNGGYKTSVTAPQNHYNFTGLDPDTLYELGTHTVDNTGNVNEKWVNATGRTAPSGLTTIQITNPSANPAIILNDNGRARPPGTNITRLNVTVTGNVSSVIIDLSPLGGLAKSPMNKISGTDIYSITTNATAGINLTNDLVVNVTDTSGNFNNSAGIPVTVLLRGDIVRDNKIDLKDLLYMRRHLAGLEPSINTFVADIQQAQGDGNVDLKDLLYLRKYLAGLETLI